MRVALVEFRQGVLEGVQFGRANKGEIFRVEEQYNVLPPQVLRQGEILDDFRPFQHGGSRKTRRFPTDQRRRRTHLAATAAVTTITLAVVATTAGFVFFAIYFFHDVYVLKIQSQRQVFSKHLRPIIVVKRLPR